jgi:hypothetical protein
MGYIVNIGTTQFILEKEIVFLIRIIEINVKKPAARITGGR